MICASAGLNGMVLGAGPPSLIMVVSSRPGLLNTTLAAHQSPVLRGMRFYTMQRVVECVGVRQLSTILRPKVAGGNAGRDSWYIRTGINELETNLHRAVSPNAWLSAAA
jgi:hypothetical protein